MEITRQRILEYFEDSKGLFFLWNEEDTFPPLDNVQLVEDVAIIFTMEGEIHFTSMKSKRTGNSSNIVIANNMLCGSIVNCSPDFKSAGIIISKKFWDCAIVHCHPYTIMTTVNPILEITEEQKDILLDFLRTLFELRKKGKKDRRPVMKHLVNDMVVEISRIYEEHVTEGTQKNGTYIMQKFTSLILENYKEHRDVDFYADAMRVQKRHLSATVKNLCGMTAFKCIQMQILIQAASELRHTDKSIKEIAMEYNFDDTSHFCKYFRKYSGLSPEEYRKCKV